MNKSTLYWFLQFSGWFLYAFINIFTLSFSNRLNPQHVVGFSLLAIFFVLSTHFFRIIIKKYDWFTLPVTILITRIVMSIGILSFTNYLFQFILNFMLSIYSEEFQAQSLFLSLLNIITTAILYIIWSLIYFFYHYARRYYQAMKYEAAINEFELNKLKSQLNPHFIFNALNSIRALVDEDPVKSKKAITQLSNILRNSLIMDKMRLISFEDELKTVKDYLDLEAIRYENRLQVKIENDPAAQYFNIPPLMIQTLVENSIKHGIATLRTGGLIYIKCVVQNGNLQVEIRNSGQYIASSTQKNPGFGLDNTRQRLKLIYGRSASFTIFNENESTVLTQIIIPKEIQNESISRR